MNKAQRPYVLILPSLFTTGNLFCGFYATLASFSGKLNYAAYAVFLALVFDSLDGRVARFTRSQSRFGLEYDSLADLLSFALVPSLMLYFWGVQDLGRLGYGVCFFYLACGALRLARFNTLTESIPKSYFVGLPSPAAASLLAALVLARQQLGMAVQPPKEFLAVLLVVLGLLMVSNIRYPSFKELEFRERKRYPLLVMLVGGIAFLVWETELAVVVLLGYYICWGGVREVVSRVRKIFTQRALRKQTKEVREVRK